MSRAGRARADHGSAAGGVCHSDLHFARNEWGMTQYPVVPGGRHGIACEIETIRMDQINEAYERMLRSEVKHRFVIYMASLKG